MKILQILTLLLFCIMLVNCEKSEQQADQNKQEKTAIPSDTVYADTLLNQLEKNTEDLKVKAKEVKNEIENLIE